MLWRSGGRTVTGASAPPDRRLLSQTTVEAGQPARQGFNVRDNFVAHVLAHLLEVVMPGAIHGQAEGRHTFPAGFQQRHARVMNGVFLLRAVATVAVILGPSV